MFTHPRIDLIPGCTNTLTPSQPPTHPHSSSCCTGRETGFCYIFLSFSIHKICVFLVFVAVYFRVHFALFFFCFFLPLSSVYVSHPAVLHRTHVCTAELDTLRSQYEAATSVQQAITAEAEDLGRRLRQLGEEASRTQQECEELTRTKEQREAEVCQQAPPPPTVVAGVGRTAAHLLIC